MPVNQMVTVHGGSKCRTEQAFFIGPATVLTLGYNLPCFFSLLNIGTCAPLASHQK